MKTRSKLTLKEKARLAIIRKAWDNAGNSGTTHMTNKN